MLARRVPLKRTPLRRVSIKRKAQLEQYAKARLVFLAAHPECEVFPWSPSVDVHHVRGRIGAMLLDERYWMAVSRKAHDLIHENPNKARAKGWLV